MGKKRSIGILLVVAIFIYWGISGVSRLVPIIFPFGKIQFNSIIEHIAVLGVPFLSSLYLFLSYGILRLQERVRIASVTLSWVNLFLYAIIWIVLINRDFTHRSVESLRYISILMLQTCGTTLFVIYYLTRHKVKEQFK